MSIITKGIILISRPIEDNPQYEIVGYVKLTLSKAQVLLKHVHVHALVDLL